MKFGNLLTEQFGNFEKPSFYLSAELQLKTRFTQQVEMNSIFVNRDILQIWKTTSNDVRNAGPSIVKWRLKLLLMVEILHQLIGCLYHDLQGLIHPRWCRISAINVGKGVITNCAFLWSPNKVFPAQKFMCFVGHGLRKDTVLICFDFCSNKSAKTHLQMSVSSWDMCIFMSFLYISICIY